MTITDIAIGRIDAAPWNSNRMDEPMRRRLLASLGRFGVVQPLVVRRQGDRYETVAGAQRLAALRADETAVVPCVVLDDLGDADARLLSVALNRIGGTDDVNLLGDIAREVLAALPSDAVASVLPHSLDHLRGLASLGDLTHTVSGPAAVTSHASPVVMAATTQAASWELARASGFDRLSFAFSASERDEVERAVALALRRIPHTEAPNHRGRALAAICTQWLAARQDDGGTSTTPPRVVREGSD